MKALTLTPILFLLTVFVNGQVDNSHMIIGNDTIEINDDFKKWEGIAEPYIMTPQAYNLSKKDIEFFTVSPSLLLLELYMDHVRKTEVHIGWDLIIEEKGNSMIIWPIFFSKAKPYLQPHEYETNMKTNILYGVDESEHIDNYKPYLKKWYDMPDYIRAEKIMRPKKASFEDFYNWSQEYFKEQLKPDSK
ncbi:hypothetical protein [Flagellimonas sp.]|uniref:hypothetical protein n=1 Tax=Flagellimonas sp. TaxID=2058762 RepID=UPI003F4A48AD